MSDELPDASAEEPVSPPPLTAPSAEPVETVKTPDLLTMVNTLIQQNNKLVAELESNRSGGRTVPTGDDDVQRNIQLQKTLPSTVIPDKGMKPGEYKLIGHDKSGEPLFAKVAWTREAIVAAYPEVTFEPATSRTISPHGVRFDLIGGQQNTVPSIVRDIYVWARDENKKNDARYAPLSSVELDKVTADALTNKQGWSRVHRIGTGPLPPDEPAAAPATNE